MSKRMANSVRGLVREILLSESVAPPSFASSVTHSAGWISPEGEYLYDPNRRDHGEWAAWEVSRNPKMMEELIKRLEAMVNSEPDFSKMSQEELLANFTELMMSANKRKFELPAGRSIEDLYYSSAQSEVRSIATKILLENGWAKVSNAYGIEVWKPTRLILDTWMNLGMEAGSDPERYHNVFDSKKSIVEGDWAELEKFMRRLP
jgi:hypothetical protein